MGPYIQSGILRILKEYHEVQIAEAWEWNLRNVHTHFTNPQLLILRLIVAAVRALYWYIKQRVCSFAAQDCSVLSSKDQNAYLLLISNT
jgi:hypothetical protein